MSNEEIVKQIKNGYSVTDNMQLLYERNLPLIKIYIRPYTSYEPEEDLLQEAYFGLLAAVNHYDDTKEVLFMSYAKYWIIQTANRYIDKCGSVMKMSSFGRQQILRYKKVVARLMQEQGGMPTDTQVSEYMGVSVREVEKYRVLSQGVSSLDAEITSVDDMTIMDCLESDLDVENSIINKIYDEQCKNELWGIVERYTGNRGSRILIDRYKENMTLQQVANKEGVTRACIHQIEMQALKKLRTGQAGRQLRAKFDIVDASLFRTGLQNYKYSGSSSVESIVLRRERIRDYYNQDKLKIEQILKSARKCK